MITVAILCAQKGSIYFDMEGLEVYDESRNAASFAGGMPIVAHPPCRHWSAAYRHFAAPAPGEKELGLFCVEQVRKHGGVVEQPAHSHLFAAAGIPLPGRPAGGFKSTEWSIAVDQYQFGYPVRKKTWLYFSRINPADVKFPLRLRGSEAGDGQKFENLSKKQRSRTVPEFAKFLIECARKVV